MYDRPARRGIGACTMLSLDLRESSRESHWNFCVCWFCCCCCCFVLVLFLFLICFVLFFKQQVKWSDLVLGKLHLLVAE